MIRVQSRASLFALCAPLPCGDSEAQKHYQDTIGNPVPKEKILPFLNPQQRSDFEMVCGDLTAVWGVTPGKLGQNKSKWERLAPGDIALLYRAKRIFSMARIVLTMHNEGLADSLWSRTSEGVTWEYIYFLDDLQEIEIPISKYNAALGYAANNIVQGFQVHQERQSEAVLSLLGLEADEAFPEPKETSTEALQARLSAMVGTDAVAIDTVRKEQGFLRSHLFEKEPTGVCDLCRRLLPVGFLVAAHIKRRESCTDAERLSLDIVMRACKLGCDKLFERGYIFVDSTGTIQPALNLEKATTHLKQVAHPLLEKETTAFRATTSAHFKWHSEHLRRKLKQL